MTTQQVQGVKLALMTATISGFSVFFNSLAVKGIDPIVHTTIKNGFAGLLVVMVLASSGQWKQIKHLSRKQAGWLLIIALIGGSLAFGLFFTGLKMIGAAQGALIHKTLILWVAMMAVPLLKEKLSWKMMLGIVLLYASSLVVGVKGFAGIQLGHGLVLLATLLWSVENVIAKMTLKTVSPNLLVTARMAVGSVFLGGYMVLAGKAPLALALTGSQWLMLLGVGLLLFGYVMSWYRALAILPVTVTAGILVGATVITSLLDAVFVSKVLSLTFVAQSALIISGIYLVIMAAMDGWKNDKVRDSKYEVPFGYAQGRRNAK
jgi:drug/metabolite transporter (DMT)-like permease